MAGAAAPVAAIAPPDKPASPAMPAAPPADHRQANKALVRRYLLEVLAAGNAGHLDDIVAKSFTDHSSGAAVTVHGAEAARQIQQRVHALFAKLEYQPQDLVAEDDLVAARYLVVGTPKPTAQQPAPAPLVVNGQAVFRIRAGRIVDVYAINDQITLMREMGYRIVAPDDRSPQGPPATGAAPPPP